MSEQSTQRHDDLVRQRGNEIATLPPLDTPPPDQVQLSPRTGEPRRPAVLTVACVAFHLGAVAASVGLLAAMGRAVTDFHGSAQVIAWVKPDPVSFLGILMVFVMAAIAVVVAAAASVVGYYAWAGRSWTRWGGLAAFALSGMAWLISPLTAASMVFVAVGAGLLWLKAATRFFRTFSALRGRGRPTAPPRTEPVVYGTLPRYR